MKNQSTLSFKPQQSDQVKIATQFKICSHRNNPQATKAALKVTNFLVHHNIPLAAADHIGPLLKDIFPDSEIAKSYASARTKTTAMLNGALAPHYRDNLVTLMRSVPFSLAIDGSSDNDLSKMNPLTVRIFDVSRGRVVTELLDMCLTSGSSAGTAATIFEKVEDAISKHAVPWENCFGVAMDNASVNMGKHNSMKTRFESKNSACYVMGCQCHVMHNTSEKASQEFEKVSAFDVEEFCIDLYYWFQKSTQRKGLAAEYYEFCDLEYRNIIKQVNTRWLSLQTAVGRALQQFPGLRSLFLSETSSDARFKRLNKIFADPMTEIYLMFYSNVLPLFTNLNLFLQREDPCVHLLYDESHAFFRRLLIKFVTVSTINASESLPEVAFKEPLNQVADDDLAIGMMTKQKLKGLLDEGDVSQTAVDKFYSSVRVYYMSAAEYALTRLPLNDAVLRHARFIDIKRIRNASFRDIEFFAQRYSSFFKFTTDDMDQLREEFVELQLLNAGTDIPADEWKKAELGEVEDGVPFHRMDMIWGYLAERRDRTGRRQFPLMSKVAAGVLALPHSNAEEERVFSLVTKNKTQFRGSMKLDGTLASILTVKLAAPERYSSCHRFQPSANLIRQAKGATSDYNKAHSSSTSE
jgi:hypothetical protein